MWQVEALKLILKKFIRALGWTIIDIIRIPLSICTYKIKLETKCVLSVEYKRILNKPIKKVAMNEIIKWLDTSIVYPISNNT